MKKYTIMTLLVALVALAAFRTAPEWVSLGTRKVNFKLDRDVLEVSYREGTFTAIKLEVNDGALNMHRYVIHFENGSKQEVDLRHNFGKGTESRVIDLKGNRRFINKIAFWYDTDNDQRRRATLTVWGRK